MAADWQRIDAYIEENVIPVLKEYGAENIEKLYPFEEPEADRIWPPFLAIQFKGERIELGRNEIGQTDQRAIKGFLKYFDRFQKIEEKMRTISDPFYSNISGYIDSEFGRRTTIDTKLGYSWICNKIRASGRRIWS